MAIVLMITFLFGMAVFMLSSLDKQQTTRYVTSSQSNFYIGDDDSLYEEIHGNYFNINYDEVSDSVEYTERQELDTETLTKVTLAEMDSLLNIPNRGWDNYGSL